MKTLYRKAISKPLGTLHVLGVEVKYPTVSICFVLHDMSKPAEKNHISEPHPMGFGIGSSTKINL